jgi:hypothetical protein
MSKDLLIFSNFVWVVLVFYLARKLLYFILGLLVRLEVLVGYLLPMVESSGIVTGGGDLLVTFCLLATLYFYLLYLLCCMALLFLIQLALLCALLFNEL